MSALLADFFDFVGIVVVVVLLLMAVGSSGPFNRK